MYEIAQLQFLQNCNPAWTKEYKEKGSLTMYCTVKSDIYLYLAGISFQTFYYELSGIMIFHILSYSKLFYFAICNFNDTSDNRFLAKMQHYGALFKLLLQKGALLHSRLYRAYFKTASIFDVHCVFNKYLKCQTFLFN